jgi:hypothetical protein
LEDSSIFVSLPSLPEKYIDSVKFYDTTLSRHFIGSKKYNGRHSIAFIIKIIDLKNVGSESLVLDSCINYLIAIKLSQGYRMIGSRLFNEQEFPYTKELIFIDEYYSGVNRARIFIFENKFYSVETLYFKRLFKDEFRLSEDEQIFFNSFRLKKN